MSDKQGKCETCRWWAKDEAWYHPAMDERVVKALQEEMIECGHMGDCFVFPSHQKTSGKHFCGQWREKNPPHLLETPPGHTEWSRELHGYDILLECQRSATAISRGSKWFIPFCAAPQ